MPVRTEVKEVSNHETKSQDNNTKEKNTNKNTTEGEHILLRMPRPLWQFYNQMQWIGTDKSHLEVRAISEICIGKYNTLTSLAARSEEYRCEQKWIFNWDHMVSSDICEW